MAMKNYFKITYAHKPYTGYPKELVDYLIRRFMPFLWLYKSKPKILDLGCGRGEYLEKFESFGWKAEGFDRSLPENIKLHNIVKIGDLERPLPYRKNTFDLVFCKSVIEHQYYPEKLISEIYRILKPGGKILILTPDIESIKFIFWTDFTHRSPFTLSSLKDILQINNFKILTCEKFIQLPYVWGHPARKIVCWIAKFFYTQNTKNKLIKFSKEKMLLAIGQK